MRRLHHFPLALLLVSGVVGGCGRAPHPVGVLRVAQVKDASTLDPARAYDTTSIQFARLLYRGLVEYDNRAVLHPEVAQSYRLAPDGLTYTFHLRPDVKYSDGTPVVADDFRFAIERVLNPETASDGQGFFSDIVGAKAWIEAVKKDPNTATHPAGIEAPDARTVIFRLNKPDATFLNYLALPFGYAIPRAHVAQLKKQGLELSENPLGCGPFTLKEWVHDGWMTLDKNPNYFRPELPRCDRIEAKFGLSAGLQDMLYEQGALDVLTISDAFPPDFLRLTQKSPWKSQVLSAPMMDIRYMAVNNEVKPFDNLKVRQAMSYAINRARIASFLTGRVVAAHGPFPPGLPAYDPNQKGYSYDPDKARALLKEAAFKDDPKAPIPLLYALDDAGYVKAAQSIQQDLSAIGMTISLKPMAYGDLKVKAGIRGPNGSRLALMAWLQDFPDPANFLDPLFNTKSISKNASLNRSFYSNPRVDKLLSQGLTMPPGPARIKVYQQAEKIVVADAPSVFLYHSQRYIVRQPWVKNFELSPAWPATYEDVSVSP